MGGLDAIISQIGADARGEAAAIVEAAERRAETIGRAADDDAARALADAGRAREAIRVDVLARRRGAVRMERSRALLATRQRLIDEALEDVRAQLLALPDREYFNLMLRIAEKAAGPGEAELRLGERDLARVPEAFVAALDALACELGGSVRLAVEPADIDGGFVLSWGDVEERCSVDALLAVGSERLRDRLSSLLFGE